MRSHKAWIRTVRLVAVACLVSSIVSSFFTAAALAGERKFLVMLATSPKQFPPNGIPGGGLTNPELIRKQYYDTTNPDIGSFAEYWEEISYGDVKISRVDRLPDWVFLPWRIQPRAGTQGYTELDDPASSYRYGVGETFNTYGAMVTVDIGGSPLGIDDGPLDPSGNPPYALGGRDETPITGQPVWMPGERFVDMDGDSRWDGLDEATNQMDWNGDGMPDLDGPWLDLNENGEPDNEGNCLYLNDDDNDGNPDCCPDGPGAEGCDHFPAPNACFPTRWEGPGGVEIVDCNGNLVPDACDVSCDSFACLQTGWLIDHPGVCGDSRDELPFIDIGGRCDANPLGNGIPDECEIAGMPGTENEYLNFMCVEAGLDESHVCAGLEPCAFFATPLTDLAFDRCEYHDVNGDGELDIVEPFEDFLVQHNSAGNIIRVDDAYITNNYPGHPQSVIAQHDARPIYGRHDPLVKTSGLCKCTDGSDCLNLGGSLFQVCVAGEHAEYNPPDWWQELGSTKMARGGDLEINQTPVTTSEPDWYVQAWVDRYGTAAPSWGAGATLSAAPLDIDARRCFRADRGGTHGNGTGWVGCGFLDPLYVFTTVDACDLERAPNYFSLACNARILPEERNGIGQPLTLFDGIVEHDDLPSSKYHFAGDQALGEVTSPYNEDIWGHDRGQHSANAANLSPDYIIPAAGPYATHIHGNFGLDGGNVLHMELLTWRTEPPFNTADAWDRDLVLAGSVRFHSLAGPYGENLGFRDYNLDGLVDQGEIRAAGSENYIADLDPSTSNNGTGSAYPFNRRRMIEDWVEIQDDVIDFDDFVDAVTLERISCNSSPPRWPIMGPYWAGPAPLLDEYIAPFGVLSSILLLPPGSHTDDEFPFAGSYYPIHNEDGLGDPEYPDTDFPTTPRAPNLEPGFEPQISWNIFFNDLVKGLGTSHGGGVIPSADAQTAYAAHEYLHTWERFPDLYDYDVWEQPGPAVNCPIGAWDIMANGGLVHPAPILKEKPCTEWTEAVNLKTVLTPGVESVLTLPRAEFYRDDSYYYLQNENRPGERYYFWSAGAGFDERMPGAGLLIQHTDFTPSCQTDADCTSVPCRNGFCEGEVSNPDAPPAQQRSATRPTYLIVQADGLAELEVCDDIGDAGDPWPGSANATQFNYFTNPPATWYTQNSWTGIDIQNIVPDGTGNMQLTMTWVPTSIPSLRFIDPPGGESVGSTYQVRFEATDVFGGTTIRLYYMADEKFCSTSGTPCSDNADCSDDEFCKYDVSLSGGGTYLISSRKKTTPGTNQLSVDWNISGLANGRYVVFAELVPGRGADNQTELKVTTPRAGRNNHGNGPLVVTNVDIAGHTARSETWTVECIDTDGLQWRVNSSLTQPVLNEEHPETDPYDTAFTDATYTSIGGEVTFEIVQGSVPFALGDIFTFTTTGITAVSRSVLIAGGQINEDPVAVITAAPLAGDPPLRVTFDGRDSYDPNGEALTYSWDFGDGTPGASGARVEHVFQNPGTFTTVLRVTNPINSRFGETAVDIEVTNNSPHAVIAASPKSGPVPLDVQFSGAQSSDTETPSNLLIYAWDFGDGDTANNSLVVGTAFREQTHFYRDRKDGTPCTHDDPCTFIATLTVIDQGGKEDTDTVSIRVGNSDPVPVITHTPLQGPDPWEVVFNAKGSSDPDGDTLDVEWTWGDGTANETLPLTGASGATDGSVPHTYVLPSGQTSGAFSTMAIVRDGRGGEAKWGPVTVVVSEATVGSSDPRAIFTIDPPEPELNEQFAVDGSLSFDRPAGGSITSYTWEWGDNTANGSGVSATHTYTQPGTYTITLTVADNESPANANSMSKTVIISSGDEEPPSEDDNVPPTAVFTVNPASGFARTTVFTFNARASNDPDGDNTKLKYSWAFGDGSTGTLDVVTHAYERPDPNGYVVRLTVRDEDNASTSVTQEVVVADTAGNLPPLAFIATGPRTGTAPVTLTFDGRNSFDPNGDPLEFEWDFMADGIAMDMLVGSVITKLFSDPGTYSVELKVSDGRGGVSRAGPETVLVTARVTPPGDGEEPPGQQTPDGDGEIPNSADQRPGLRACGFGMIGTLFASLLGLTAMMALRGRVRAL